LKVHEKRVETLAELKEYGDKEYGERRVDLHLLTPFITTLILCLHIIVYSLF